MIRTLVYISMMFIASYRRVNVMGSALILVDKDFDIVKCIASSSIKSAILEKTIYIAKHLVYLGEFISKQMNWGNIRAFSIKIDGMDIAIYFVGNGFIVYVRTIE